MEARNRAFQLLKPPCVKLSESALKLMGKNGTTKDVVDSLDQVRRTLQAISMQKDILNDKLADYAFFPLSHVLKQLEKLPVRAEELTLECLSILLRTAWKDHIAPELGIQLLILFSFVADQKGSRTSEELQDLTFTCIGAVFSSLGHEEQGQEALIKTPTVPHLGKAVSVILDGILDGVSDSIQTSAVKALQAFCESLSDRDALATSFLPGIMSCLTKVLTPKASRRVSLLLTASLEVLARLIPRIFSDDSTRNLPEDLGIANLPESRTGLDKKWLRATAPQIKMALGNIVKLRQHDRKNVRQSLAKLCMAILQLCRESLSESVSMVLETTIVLADQDETVERELKNLLATEPNFTEDLRSSLHYWIISLPRIMHSADDTGKHRRMHQISLSYKLLSEQDVDMSMIEADLAANLRDSVFNAIHERKEKKIGTDSSFGVQSLELAQLGRTQSTDFSEILTTRKGPEEMLTEMSRFIQQLTANSNFLDIVQDLVDGLNGSSGDLQLASFWLSLNILRQSLSSTLSIDDILDFGNNGPSMKEDMLEQLYDFSISILTDTSAAVDQDWRLQALALETLALQARQQKLDFRNELIEALYPVLHMLGSPVPQVRNHAMTCLNILATECGYNNSGELVVANVDYLVNAVALRLNSFDISPQAPQVLLMMVKLSGTPLLPYLDDLVDSMFAALESFHGYPKLAELLFSVLKVIVEEGVKKPLLAITDGQDQEAHRKRRVRPTDLHDVITEIQAVQEFQKKTKIYAPDVGTFPRQPWKDAATGLDVAEGKIQSEEIDVERQEQETTPDTQEVDPQPPAPKIFSLLLSISKLTQHYLTSSSPELRTSLLSLLGTTFPALAKHENSFLPLINTLWPVLLPRLEDNEAYVVAGAMDVIGAMCVNAGDFMSGRISDAWSTIKKIHRTRTGRAGTGISKSQSLGAFSSEVGTIVSRSGREISQSNSQPHYIDAPSRIIWESLVQLLTTITNYIRIDDETFGDIVDMLSPIVTSRDDVRDALEGWNPDAVWLALWRLESLKSPDTRTKDKGHQPKPRVQPTIKPEWQFAAMV